MSQWKQPQGGYQDRWARVDAKDLVASAGSGLRKTGKGPAAGKVLADARLGDIFGIEIDAEAQPVERAAPARAPTRAKGKAPLKAAPAVKVAAVARRPAAAAEAGAVAAPGKRSPAKRKASTGKKVSPRARSSAGGR